jgi:aldehyde:ferredoxin oxidoreductase
MGGGYAGKILRIDLSTKTVGSIPTSDYEEYGGGHGMGSAIFFDLCKDKTVDAFDPGNVVTVMTGPLQGTLTPGASGRCEVQGIGPQGYPKQWFTRTNFGGRFAGNLKFAGWDGVVLEGKAPSPVWVDIRNGNVEVRDATADGLWGLDTFETEKTIYKLVRDANVDGWFSIGNGRDSGRTTQKPAVLSIGPAGENMAVSGCLIHEGGGGAGQTGMGAVWGSKNLKAISVLGTGDVAVADPKALMEARAWAQKGFWTIDDPQNFIGLWSNLPAGPSDLAGSGRAQGCLACSKNCHGGRGAKGLAPGSHCVDGGYGMFAAYADPGGDQVTAVTTDRMQRLGINAWEICGSLPWLLTLYKQGILGKGKKIDSSLPWDKCGSEAFNKAFLEAMAYKTDIGKDLALGIARCAEKWGRYEMDTKSGILGLQCHGYPRHYDARTETEWGFGSMVSDRDINEHDFNWVVYWYVSMSSLYRMKMVVTAEEMANLIGEKLLPYKDPKMLDYSEDGMYSDAAVKLVSWHRDYSRFWKQSAMYCDWAMADFLSPYREGYSGLTPEYEPKFYNAVTGKNMTFEDGMDLGRKIWNLDRSIWCLQGRTREYDKLDEWQYLTGKNQPIKASYEEPYVMPALVDGKWEYLSVEGRILDKARVEEWKTKFYAFEGWDDRGVPTKETLEKQGLGKVAAALQAAGKLG